MKKEEAIKYLQQLYTNSGHCWLDEQRIEAIDMAIQALQEEPISEKKCMFTKDSYTDEDRKVLCDGCEEECKYSKSDDFTIALAECILQSQCNVVDPMVLAETWKDELIKLAKSEEPVSEDLEEAARKYFKSLKDDCFISSDIMLAFKVGAKWQKEQMEKNRLAHCDKQTKEEAEKDLELTVDDIKNIDRLLNQCVDYSNPYQEVLKRFKERKEK